MNVMEALNPRTEPPSQPLYDGLIVSKHFDPEALIAEVEDALRFVWPDPDPVHNITATSWHLYEPEELLRLIAENDRAEATRQASIDDPSTLADAKLINGVVYRNQECANCGHLRLMPTDVTLCVPCDAAMADQDDAARNNALFGQITQGLFDEDDHDEHPVTIHVAADITPDALAELIILHPYAEVWRGMVAATNPIQAGEMWDKAMTIADRITAP
jgi:hypothetical protein